MKNKKAENLYPKDIKIPPEYKTEEFEEILKSYITKKYGKKK